MHLRISYEKSAVFPKDYPQGMIPEVALVGRSNAGKSSGLNALAHSDIAKVSKTAGKTRLLNFFLVEDRYRIVDMPGYGHAVRSKTEKEDWKEMIETYFSMRAQLQGCILFMDIRRDWTADEGGLVAFLKSIGKGCCVVLTKVDKLGRSELAQRKKKLQQASGVKEMFFTSALKKQGYDELEEFIYKEWIRGAKL
ncbi:MAG: ribosome biogenesis GTP-binding protein YihA/YsxC [Pseudobdellovibrionaceae bacterium]